MATYRSKGFILRRYDAREHDTVFHVYTEDRGSQYYVSKATRKLESKLRPFLEPFTELDIMVAYGKSMDRLISVSPLASHKVLKNSFEKIQLAYALYELLLHVGEDTHYAHHYRLIKNALFILNEEDFDFSQYTYLLFSAVAVRFLISLGLFPELDICVVCRKSLTDSLFFHFEHGGFVHFECMASRDGYYGMELSHQELLKALFYEEFSFELLKKLEMRYNPQVLQKVYLVLFQYWQYRLEKPLKMPAILKSLCQK